MIVRGRPTFWEIFYLSLVIPRILPQLAGVLTLSLLVVVLSRHGWAQIPSVPTVGLTVIGAALSIFAAFRNSASYERWWEARKNAGLIIVELRNLSRQANCYIAKAPGDDLPRRFGLRCIAFMQVTRDFLRDRHSEEEVSRYLSPEESAAVASSRNGSSCLLAHFSADIAGAVAAGRLSPQMARTLEEKVSALALACGTLERTKATPIPFSYTLALRRLTYMFCFLVPLGIHDTSTYWTPLLAVIISYIFFGLDVLAEVMEGPFNDTSMVIPLDAMTRGFEIYVLESLGEKNLPEPIRPKGFVLT
ncbi:MULTISPECIES: bestrophin family protein [unclassified Bradyrhizobium]|uniref:bestrophin family protein n=1 Tax=unclassified Bradyrhizobium TaxID=2631580 RepID=UPI0013E1E02B|nr:MULTISPECIES: bestrophin family protein [unclassified Bradyrhizobium]QIG98277.1 bestrophin [Bradyrhizobium sp. 6(2017)]